MAVESAINEARSLSCCAVVWTALQVLALRFLAKRHFVFASPDGSQRGDKDQKMARGKRASCKTLASSKRRARPKRPAYTVNQRCAEPASSARPLETKRLQRLSRKSRSHYSKRDRRSPLDQESSASDSTPRALARALPARLVERSGPRQRPLRRQSFLALNPGGSAGRGRKP